MIPEDLRNFLEKHSLTVTGFARMLAADQGTVRNWLSGKNPVPGPVQAYIRVMDSLPYKCPCLKRELTYGKKLKPGPRRVQDHGVVQEPSAATFPVVYPLCKGRLALTEAKRHASL